VASGVTTVRPPSFTPGPLNPPNISTLYIYDRDSRLVQQVEDDNTVSMTQYDGMNRMVLRTDPQGDTIATSYDADNNVVQTVETDVSQKPGVANETFTTNTQCDSHNRMTSQSDNCQNTRNSAYDSRNNLTDMSDAESDNTLGCSGSSNTLGNSTRYVYDGLNRRIEVIQDLRTGGIGSNGIDTTNSFNPGGMITTMTAYDGNGRMVRLTDSNGNVTQTTYDALDRKMTVMLADGTKSSYTYDRDDNVTGLTDNNGTLQTMTYDGINRRVQTSVTPVTGVIGTTLQAYQYDGLSRMTQFTDNNDPSDSTSASTVNTAYDSLGRVVEENENGKAVDSAWSSQAQRTILTYPNARQLDFTYDSLERVLTIQDAGASNSLTQYTYIGPGRVLERLDQNGTMLTYLDNAGTTDIGYDSLRRQIERRDLHTADNSLIVGFTYVYDRMGNKITEGKLHSTANSELYTYDSAYRITDFARGSLSGSTPPTIPSPSDTEDWTLDGLSNWRINLINGVSQTRSVNNTNEYGTIVTGGGSPSTDMLSYDSNGNVVSSTGQQVAYQWDYKNRPRKVCTLSGSATHCTDPGATLVAVYSYDALNRRTRKVITNSGSLNGTTNYYYDDWRTVEEHDGTDTLTQQYVYGAYLDEPVVLDRASGPRLFYHQNALYSTFALTDPTGTVSEGYQYDAYGQQTVLGPDFMTVLGTTSGVGNPYMFTGQRSDPEDGLLYYKNRYESPRLGRFESRDPLGIADSINPYEYVRSRPTFAGDPTGLWTCCKGVATYWQINGYASQQACIDGVVNSGLAKVTMAAAKGAEKLPTRAYLELVATGTCMNWMCVGGYAPTVVATRCEGWFMGLFGCGTSAKFKCSGSDLLYSRTEFGVRPDSGYSTPTGWKCQ
jgi:RHS repeat-associated protein